MKRLLSLALLSFLTVSPLSAKENYSLNWYQWTQHPWEIRYVIVVSHNYVGVVGRANKMNAKREAEHSPEFRRIESLFEPAYPLKDLPNASNIVAPTHIYNYKELGFQVIAFDRQGKVLTPHTAPRGLVAKHTISGAPKRVAFLVEGDAKPGDNWYWLGDWFQGFPGDKGSEFSPAFCHYWDDGRYRWYGSSLDKDKRYKPKEVARYYGLIGCREWTYQLYRPVSLAGDGGQPPKADGTCNSRTPPVTTPDGRSVCEGLAEHNPKDVQPYINVTTYLDKAGKKTFIGEFQGWARFDDPPRPVIGKHGDYWVCLHECPDGEAPGLIPDIKAWTAKRGWPLPKRVPFFPDSRFKPTAQDLAE